MSLDEELFTIAQKAAISLGIPCPELDKRLKEIREDEARKLAKEKAKTESKDK